MNDMRVVVAGSRGITDYNYVKEQLDMVFSTIPIFKGKDIIIISGTAKGVDILGENYAFEKGLHKERYPADWDNLGKRAGVVRNIEMGKVSNAAVVIWDGVSKGSKHMVDVMKDLKKPVIVIVDGEIVEMVL